MCGVKSTYVRKFTVHFLCENNTATVCILACVSVCTQCMFITDVTSYTTFSLSWDKAGVSAACCALALLHCIHTYSHTGDNQPFPLPQHETVCAVCASVSVCKWRSLFMWQMGSHSSGSHGGGTKSLLDAITFTPHKNFFWMGGILVELDRLKICASALSVCAWVMEHQTEPNKTKECQSKPSFRPKACVEK